MTPGHDFNDYEVGRRHGLPILNILDQDAKIVADAAADLAGIPPELRGLDRFEARKRVVAMLEAQGLLEKTSRTPRPCRAAIAAMPCSSRGSLTSGT